MMDRVGLNMEAPGGGDDEAQGDEADGVRVAWVDGDMDWNDVFGDDYDEEVDGAAPGGQKKDRMIKRTQEIVWTRAYAPGW